MPAPIAQLPSNLLEDIRKLSGTWQPEWMAVCKAFHASAMEHRDERKTLLLVLEHKEGLADRLRRVGALPNPIRLVSPHVMRPWELVQLRPSRMRRAVPLPERLAAPFSLLAQRRYFETHHNLREAADCLMVCLEAAGMQPRIRGVDLFLIAPQDEETYAEYENEEPLARLLVGLPRLESLAVRARAPHFQRTRDSESRSFRVSFMHRMLSRVAAESASLRRLTLVDASLRGPLRFGMELLLIAEHAMTGYFRASPQAPPTLGRRWFLAHELENDHGFAMPNAASRIETLRVENVIADDWISDRFWAIAGSHQVARLELIGTLIDWPSTVRRGGPTIFPGGRISRPAMTLAISSNRGQEPFDPAAFVADGVVCE